MTIPTRPAPPPPPPATNAQSAATNASASIAQLRIQLQKQQRQHQQEGNALPNLVMKLPPPPKINSNGGGVTTYQPKRNEHIAPFDAMETTSITRKFPKVRLTHETNWNDTNFETSSTTGSIKSFKKLPPPRPPPPNIQRKRQELTSERTTNAATSSLLTNIFQRKKTVLSTTKATTKTTTARATNKTKRTVNQSHVYGLSTGNTNAVLAISSSANDVDWNAVWNSTNNNYATTTTRSYAYSNNSNSNSNSTTSTSNIKSLQEAQLISFDSPTSSPTFTQKSRSSDCASVDSLSLESNFNSPINGFISQPESGFEDDFSSITGRSRPPTVSPKVPCKDPYSPDINYSIGTAPVRNVGAVAGQRNPDNPLCNGKSLLPPAPTLHVPTIIKPKIPQKPKAPMPQLAKAPPVDDLLDDPPTPPSPPMPNCAPPPPPPAVCGISLLDVIQGKVDALALESGSSGYLEGEQKPYAIALYDFDGLEEGDLCFRANEKLYLLERASENWYRGRTRAGCEGIFPCNYVEIKVPLLSEESRTKESTKAGNITVRCLYDFPAQIEGDLALNENDMVTVLYRINEDWLFGEIRGKQGQFPANFLEYVPENLPTS